MARKIVEQKIIQLGIDDEKFKTGLQESIKSLSGLDKAIEKIDGTSIDKAEKSTGRFSDRLKELFSKIPLIGGIGKKFQESAQGIEMVGEKTQKTGGFFSRLGNVAVGAFNFLPQLGLAAQGFNVLTGAISNALTPFTKLKAEMSAGFGQFEEKIDTVNMMLLALGEGARGAITHNLDELQRYAATTKYSVKDMHSSLGQFVNAGIDINQATTALKGWGNLAASAGATTDGFAASLRFGVQQALAMGKMNTQNWVSVENAGMATQRFKDILMQTADELGIARDQSKSFRDSLSDGWLTNEVMIRSLEKLAADESLVKAASEFHTFKEAAEAAEEAVTTSWANFWEALLGTAGSEDLTKFWTRWGNLAGDVLSTVGNKATQMAQKFVELGGRNLIFEGMEKTLSAITSILGVMKIAWNAVFPDSLVRTVTAVTNAFAGFVKNIAVTQGPLDMFHQMFDVIFRLLNWGINIISAVSKAFFGLVPVGKILELVFTGIGMAFSFLNGVMKVVEYAFGNLVKFAQPLINVFGKLSSFIHSTANSIVQFATGQNQKMIVWFDGLVGKMQKVVDWFSKLTKVIWLLSPGLRDSERSFRAVLNNFLYPFKRLSSALTDNDKHLNRWIFNLGNAVKRIPLIGNGLGKFIVGFSSFNDATRRMDTFMGRWGQNTRKGLDFVLRETQFFKNKMTGQYKVLWGEINQQMDRALKGEVSSWKEFFKYIDFSLLLPKNMINPFKNFKLDPKAALTLKSVMASVKNISFGNIAGAFTDLSKWLDKTKFGFHGLADKVRTTWPILSTYADRIDKIKFSLSFLRPLTDGIGKAFTKLGDTVKNIKFGSGDGFSKIGSQFSRIGTDVGKSFSYGIVPGIVLTIDAFQKWVRQLAIVRDYVKGMGNVIGIFVKYLSNVATNISKVNFDFSSFSKSLRSVKDLFGSFVQGWKQLGSIKNPFEDLNRTIQNGFISLSKWIESNFGSRVSTVFKVLAVALTSPFVLGFSAAKIALDFYVTYFQRLSVFAKSLISHLKNLKTDFSSFNGVARTASGFIKAFGDALRDAGRIRNPFTSLIDGMKKAFETFVNWLERFFGPGVANVFKAIPEVAGTVFKFLGKGFDELMEFLKKSGLSLENSKENFEKWGKTIEKVWDTIKKIFKAIKDSFVEAFGDNTVYADELPGDEVAGTMREAHSEIQKVSDEAERLGNQTERSLTNIEKFFSAISKSWKKVTGIFSPKNASQIESISKTLINIAGLYAAFKTFKSLDAGSKFLGNITSKLLEVPTAVKGVADSIKNLVNAKTSRIKIINFAIAIGTVTAALLVLSMIPADKLKTGLLGLAAALGAMTIIWKVMEKSVATTANAKRMEKGAKSMLGVATSLGLVAIAIAVLGNLSESQLLKGGVTALIIGSVMTIMLGVAARISGGAEGNFKLGVSLGTFLGLAYMMKQMAKVLKDLGEMDWPDGKKLSLQISMFAMIMGSMILLVAVMGRIRGVNIGGALSILAVAKLLKTIVREIEFLGEMNFNTLLQGGITMGLVVLGLVGVMHAMKHVNSASVKSAGLLALALSALLGVFTWASKSLKGVDMSNITIALTEIIGTIFAMSMIVNAMDGLKDTRKGIKSVMKLVEAVVIMAGAMALLSYIPFGPAVGNMLAIVGALSALTVISKILEKDGVFAKGDGVKKVQRLAVSLVFLSGSLLILSNIPWNGSIIGALMGIGIALGGMAYIATMLDKNTFDMRGVKMVERLALVLVAMSASLMLLSFIPWNGTIVIALAGVLGSLFIMAKIAEVAGRMKNGETGVRRLGFLAAELVIASIGLTVLAKIPWNNVLSGLAMLAGGMAIMVIAAKVMGALNPSAAVGLLAITASLTVASVGLLALAQIPWDNVASGLIMLAGGLTVLLLAGAVAGGIPIIGAGLLIVAGALALIVTPIGLVALGFAAFAQAAANLTNAITGLVTTIVELGEQGGQRIRQFVNGADGAFKDLAQQIGGGFISGFIQAITTNAASIITTIVSMGVNIVTALLTQIPGWMIQLASAILDGLTTIAMFIENNTDRIALAFAHIGIASLKALVNTLIMPFISLSDKYLHTNLRKGFDDFFDGVSKGADKMFQGVHISTEKGIGEAVDKIASASSEVKAHMAEMANNMQDGYQGVVQFLNGMGIQGADSFAKGLKDGSISVEEGSKLLKEAAEAGVSDTQLKAFAEKAGLDWHDGILSKKEDSHSAGKEVADAAGEGAQSVDMQGIGSTLMKAMQDGITADKLGPILAAQGVPQEAITAMLTNSDGSSVGGKLDTTMIAGMVSKLGDVKSAGGNIAQGAVDSAKQKAHGAVEAGSQAGDNYTQGVKKHHHNARRAGSDLADGAKNGVSSRNGEFHASGSTIGNSFASGIRSAMQAVGNAASGLVSWARSFFPNSPAKRGAFSGRGWYTFIRSGGKIASIFADGIRSGVGSVGDAASAVAEAAQNGLDIISDIAYDGLELSPTISPVLDLSNLREVDLSRASQLSLQAGSVSYNSLNPNTAQFLNQRYNIDNVVDGLDRMNRRLQAIEELNIQQADLISQRQIVNTYLDGDLMNRKMAPGMQHEQTDYTNRMNRLKGVLPGL